MTTTKKVESTKQDIMNDNEIPITYDIAQTLQDLQKPKPPIKCSFCSKIFCSVSGINYHINKFHSHRHVRSIGGRDGDVYPKSIKRSLFSYAETDMIVKFESKGLIYHKTISSEIPIELGKAQEEGDEGDKEGSSVLSPAKSSRLFKSKKTSSIYVS